MPHMLSAVAQLTPLLHPLDLAEELLLGQDISHDRPVDDEVVGEMLGDWGSLKLWYRWEEALGVLVFTCAMDAKIPSAMRPKLYPLLAAINEKLWLGHFDISADEGIVMFRYSLLVRGNESLSEEMLEALLEISVTECNRFYPVMQGVLWGNQPMEEALTIALFETCGEA